MKATFLFAFLIFGAFVSGYSDPQKGKRMATFCSLDGKGGVKCDYNGQACVMLHPDICGEEGPMPSCCNASPDSPDRNAKECHCCGAQK